ncbi:hypothetical protein ACVWXE_001402 [Thermostichus sp. MS-CIW-41]
MFSSVQRKCIRTWRFRFWQPHAFAGIPGCLGYDKKL